MGTLPASGRRLHLRGFLEGIEIPVISATVQAAINSPAVSTVQVVPSDRLLELKPRTLIHLFYWDSDVDGLPTERNPGAPLPTTSPEKATQPSQGTGAPASQSVPNLSDELKGYKLLFGGEVMGVSVTKTPLARQMVLQCIDWSSYWDTCYQIMISYGPNGNFLTETSAVWGGGSNLFDDILSSHSGVMNGLLSEGSRNGPKTPGLEGVRGLMGGIIRLLEAMGGVPNHSKGANDFFAIGELMRHLTQQITAEQDDNTAQQLFDNKAFWAWLERGGTSLGELVTFRDMIKLFFQWVYYEVVPVTSPMYVPAVADEVLRAARTVSANLSEQMKFRLITLKKFSDAAAEAAKNKDLEKLLGSDSVGMEKQLKLIRSANIPPSSRKAVGKAIQRIQRIRISESIITEDWTFRTLGVGRTVLDDEGKPQKIQMDPSKVRWDLFQKNWEGVSKDIDEALGVKSETVRQAAKIKKGSRDRLQTQVFRPDCFFAPPPRCNVFFPDQYTQFSYQRNFFQETTRLRLQTQQAFIGGDALLGEFHYAPSLKAIKDNAKKQGSSGLRSLLPWEKYTGILPKFESIHEVNFIANKREREMKKNIKGEAKDYSQRSANFNFYKYRFAARSIELSARFCPQVVVGFPGLVIERPFILDINEVEERLAKARIRNVDLSRESVIDAIQPLAAAYSAPTQYLGMITGVTHTLDQSGGSTQVSMSHARTHRIADDDFLDVLSQEVINEVNTQDVITILDAQELLDKGDYKNLTLLIRLTPQSILDETMELYRNQDDLIEPEFDLMDRPYGPEPQKATLKQVSPGVFANATTADLKGAVKSKKERTFSGYRGKSHTEQLRGTSTEILVPDNFGKIKPNDKGPNGGTITQIELFDDSAVRFERDEGSGLTAQKKTVGVTKKITQVVPAVDAVSGGTVPTQQGLPPVAEGYTTQTIKIRDHQRVPEFGKSEKVLYAWRRIALHEAVERKTKVTTIPVEEAIRPPWFSPIYSNLFIGEHVYTPFFGCGSIVDEIVYQVTDQGQTTGGVASKRQELFSRVRAAEGNLSKITDIMREYTGSADKLSEIPSIEQAVDTAAYLYGEVRRLGLDVHRFIADYTSRPIATMEDIFGTADLEYVNEGGKPVQAKDENGKPKGKPGFHSTSIGEWKDLHGLVDNPDNPLPKFFDDGKKFPIDKTLDPRPERRARVLAYVGDLYAGQGSLGVGLVG